MAEISCAYCKEKTNLGHIVLKDKDEEGYPKLSCGDCIKEIENETN